MSLIVARTCTELKVSDDGQVRLGASRPLSGFRSRLALVLLGDPGAGKTTEFERECDALGDGAKYLKARNFATLDIDSHPEWRDKVLFIDGLDEMRAGADDGRVPLDEIRHRLDRLRPPGFRISCREADWLGHNDRESMDVVSLDGQVTVVRLDPLDPQSIRELLGSLIPGDVEGFIDEALHRDVWPLLENPLTLKLLADAVQKGDDWPESRRETFETACRELASERNPEHRIAAPPIALHAVLDAAGYLCALQLLSGIEGYSLPPGPHDSSFMELDRLEQLPEHVSLGTLRQTLATRLFTAEGETAFVPIHRQVAEFLGGCYLAGLVEDGLPARRINALMTSPAVGRVVTELRGLSAWLAAHSPEARRLLIEADPVGVGLYGDIGGFALNDKERLLGSLAAFARQGPLLGHGWSDGRNDGFRDYTAWAFRSLASADMAPAITKLLDPEDGEHRGDRVMEFVLNVLSKANRDLKYLGVLVPCLEAILNDSERSDRARKAALDTYIRVAPFGNAKTRELRSLLESAQDGSIPDPDDELRGALLRHLYPDALSPTEVWRYVGPRHRRRLFGRFWLFWFQTLLEKSSNQQVALLLDALHDNDVEIVHMLHESGFDGVPVRLLASALTAKGDEVEISRLYNWLSATRPRIEWTHVPDGHTEDVRKWLEARPYVQKGIVLEWIARNDPSDPATFLGRSLRDVLHRSRLPTDFGSWCLDQAIALSAARPVSSKRLIEMAYHSARDPSISQGLTLEQMHERLLGHETIGEQLRNLDRPYLSPAMEEHQRELEERRVRYRAEGRKRTKDWENLLRSQETELRENRFSPENLDKLARVFFGWVRGDRGLSATERLGGLIGGDQSLVALVMPALKNAIRRHDVPDADLSISLYAESRRPWLATPVLAGMYLLADNPQGMEDLDEEQKSSALAIYYCWGNVHPRPGSACRALWFREQPAMVLDVLYRCAIASVRRGDESLTAIHDLDRLEDHADLVQETRLRLLEAFPTRIPKQQLRPFDRVLSKTLEHGATSRLEALAAEKLAMKSLGVSHRVRWLTVAALLSEGQRTEHLRTYIGQNERRVRHLAEFLRNSREDSDGLYRILSRNRDPAIYVTLVELLGRSFGPCDLDGFVTLEISASQLIDNLISQLRSMPDVEAHKGLDRLVDDPGMARWRDRLTRAEELQRVVYSDASYRHPNIKQVQDTLNNRAPANAADLAALLRDRLEAISDHVRGDSANLWRQFWNEDSYRRPIEAKPEDSCRDALLEALRHRLPSGTDAAPEGRYAADRRADIRVAYGGFNIPIEIKKNSHPDLWSARRNQLIDRYTTDPATSGYGIYLVLWFGPDETTRSPDGVRPATPDDLRRVLESELPSDEPRKVSVIVMDVTKPGVPSPRVR